MATSQGEQLLDSKEPDMVITNAPRRESVPFQPPIPSDSSSESVYSTPGRLDNAPVSAQINAPYNGQNEAPAGITPGNGNNETPFGPEAKIIEPGSIETIIQPDVFKLPAKPQYKLQWLFEEADEILKSLVNINKLHYYVNEELKKGDRAYFATSRRSVEDAAALCNLLNGMGYTYSPYSNPKDIYHNREIYLGDKYSAGMTPEELSFIEKIHKGRASAEQLKKVEPFGIDFDELKVAVEHVNDAVADLIEKADEERKYFRRQSAEKAAQLLDYEEKLAALRDAAKEQKEKSKQNLKKLSDPRDTL